MEDPRKVVEEIRANKFGIGSSSKNPLAVDMHEAIRHLAAELYQKDLHFVMELVQNADDNTYPEGVVPELEFMLVDSDLAGVGVDWTLVVLNNEVGFSRANVESLCSIGRSTKTGRRDSGYIGEKGIGFKSVFLVTHHPVVISNGYRIRFNDAPTHDTQLGFIVPEWAEQPTDAELAECLNIDENELPSTIIVLPIRQDKIQAVREQLFQISSKLVLFLNKIDRLSACQLISKGSAGASPVSKGMLVERQTVPAPPQFAGMIPNNCSYSTVSLSSSTGEALYHVWQQEFCVETKHEVEHRQGIHTLTMTLAFPTQENPDDDAEPDIYAFLPTKVAAGFPFLINADFLLVSSRDTIRFDSEWNKCILSQIPHVFMAAFMFLLKIVDFSLGATSFRDVYTYVPYDDLYIGELGFVRNAIIGLIKAHNTILCDENIGQHFPAGPVLAGAGRPEFPTKASYFFCQPALARTIDPNFRRLLKDAHDAKLPPPKPLTFQRMYIVDEDVQDMFEEVLKTVGVECFSSQLYVLCLQSPNWVMNLPDAMYVELLKLLKEGLVDPACIQDLPLVKYLDDQNKIQLLAPRDKDVVSVYFSKKQKDVTVLTQWTPIFQRWMSVHFMPNSTVRVIEFSKELVSLYEWLKSTAGIQQLSVKTYAQQLANMFKDKKNVLQDEASLALGTMHFILHCVMDGYLSEDEYAGIFSEFPLLDRSGEVYFKFTGPILLPASVSKWPKYLLNDTWDEHILWLSDSYLELPSFMMDGIGSHFVTQFLRQAVKAGDIFDIKTPPDAPFFIPSPWALTASEVKSFLAWIKGLAYIPNNLKKSLKESCWVKTVEHGDKKPSMSFLDVGGQWNNVLTRKDVPFVDTRFYGDLHPYCSILTELGMVTKKEDGAQAVAEHMQCLSKVGFYEVQSDSAQRWYKYLRSCSWMGWARSKTLQVIWVPDGRRGSTLGSWRSAQECVISDSGGLFYDRLFVLSKYYKDENILLFFRDNMGVAATPGTEKYCQLWVDWGENNGTVGLKECQNAWCMIATGWQSLNKKASWEGQTFVKRCRIPCLNNGAQQEADFVALARPTEVLYADNIILAEIFSKAYPCPKFAWYPRSAAAATWVDDLITCYTDIGVKPLSQALMGSALHTSKIKRPPVMSPKGEIGKGMYRAILGYLADSKHRLSAQARKRMVMHLKNVEVCLVDEVGEVECRVLAGGKLYSAKRAALVRWENGEKKIYVAMPAGCSKVQVGHELANEVAKGVVGGERVFLVEGLQDFLGLAAGYNFDDNAVQYLLSLRNLRLTLEDEALLQEQQLEKSTTDYL